MEYFIQGILSFIKVFEVFGDFLFHLVRYYVYTPYPLTQSFIHIHSSKPEDNYSTILFLCIYYIGYRIFLVVVYLFI